MTELEDVLRIIFTRGEHRRRHPGRRVVMPVMDELSMALHIDTEEEARESGVAVIGAREPEGGGSH